MQTATSTIFNQIKEQSLFPTSLQTSSAADAHLKTVLFVQSRQQTSKMNFMFIGPCIIVIVEE